MHNVVSLQQQQLLKKNAFLSGGKILGYDTTSEDPPTFQRTWASAPEFFWNKNEATVRPNLRSLDVAGSFSSRRPNPTSGVMDQNCSIRKGSSIVIVHLPENFPGRGF